MPTPLGTPASGGGAGAASHSFTLNMSAATNGVVVVTVNGGDANPVVSGVTIGAAGPNQRSGVLAIRQDGHLFSASRTHPTEKWVIADTDHLTGNQTVVVSYSTTGEAYVGAAQFEDVDQTTPIRSGSGTGQSGRQAGGTFSIDVTCTVGDLVIDGISKDNTTAPTAGAGQTRYRSAVVSDTGAASYEDAAATTVTMSWTNGDGSNSSWTQAAFALAPPSGGGGGGFQAAWAYRSNVVIQGGMAA